MGTLLKSVTCGDLGTLTQLKAEFRRRSLVVHPDTSGHRSDAFLVLRKDYEDAMALLLSTPRNEPVTFDFEEFSTLMRRAQAVGLPSRRLMRSAANRSLVAGLVSRARAHSPPLGQAVAHYFTTYDRAAASDFPSSELERCFMACLTNFLDAIVNHGRVGERAQAMILSYWNEAETRLKSQPHHPLSAAWGLLEWIRDYGLGRR